MEAKNGRFFKRRKRKKVFSKYNKYWIRNIWKIIKLGICINEHKHESERSFNYEDAINNLNLIHTFMSEFYNHELGLKIQSFNRSFYDHLIASSDYEIMEKRSRLIPLKDSKTILLRYNLKIVSYG